MPERYDPMGRTRTEELYNMLEELVDSLQELPQGDLPDELHDLMARANQVLDYDPGLEAEDY